MLSYNHYLLKLPRLDEVSSDAFDSIASKVDKINPSKLPLNDIFQGKIRVALPLNTSEIQHLTSALQDNGFEPNYANGTATKEIQTQKGSKQQAMKIGRAIELLVKSNKIDQKWWDYWNRESGFLMKQAKENPKFAKSADPEYSIIISRSPVDLLRMSDHDKIRSCHSEGGDYFNCAIQEAVDGGAIAYLVDTADLKKVDLQAPEIFADPDRNIKGIHPDARTRIRLFANDKMQLGIPEKRIYGTTVPGFREAIRDFLMKKQAPILNGQRPRMSEFKLRGGSYHDNMASTLFNDFFGDKIDSGDVGREAGKNEDDAVEAYNAARLHEIRTIDNRYNKDLHKNVSIGFTPGDEADEDGRIDFYWHGTVTFEFAPKTWNAKEANKYKSELYKLMKEFNASTPGRIDTRFEDAYIDDSALRQYDEQKPWKVNQNYGKGNVKLDCQIYTESGGPDEYRDFIENVKRDYSEKYDILYATMRKLLLEKSIIVPDVKDKLANIVHGERFEHFRFSDDEDPYENEDQESLAIQSEKIILFNRRMLQNTVRPWPEYDPHRNFHNPDHAFTQDPSKHSGPNRDGYWPNMASHQKFQLVQQAATKKVRDWWGRVKQSYEQQPWLPGFQKPPFKDRTRKMLDPQLKFDWSGGYPDNRSDQSLTVTIHFPFNWEMPATQVVSALRGIHFLDNNFDRFVGEIKQATVAIFQQEVDRFNKEKEQPQPVAAPAPKPQSDEEANTESLALLQQDYKDAMASGKKEEAERIYAKIQARLHRFR